MNDNWPALEEKWTGTWDGFTSDILMVSAPITLLQERAAARLEKIRRYDFINEALGSEEGISSCGLRAYHYSRTYYRAYTFYNHEEDYGSSSKGP